MERCTDFQEHAGWQEKHPTGPVTWDAHCSLCGFALRDRDFASGTAIEGNGRRLAYVKEGITFGGHVFHSEEWFIVCSKCVPRILGATDA